MSDCSSGVSSCPSDTECPPKSCKPRPCPPKPCKPKRGPTGPRGPRGCSGKDGKCGKCGPRGRDGDTGPKGCRGPRGNQGDRGSRGAQGSRGSKGDTGPQGPDSGQFPFLQAYEVISWSASDAAAKSVGNTALGIIDHQIIRQLHMGKNGVSSTPLFQNLRITSKSPGAIMEISWIPYEPYLTLLNGFALYSAGDLTDQPSVDAVIQPITVQNNDNKATFILQDLAFGVAELSLTFNIDNTVV